MFWTRFDFWLYLAAWIPYAGFVVLYATRSPWYRTGLGRSLLLSKTVVAVLLTHALLIVIFGRRYPGVEYVHGFLVGGVIVAGWYQLAYLTRLQRQARRCTLPSEESRWTDSS